MAVTIFSWGYSGWGYAAGDLVAVVDAIEANRGSGPPLFVDVRSSRSVRASGFREGAFAALLGPDRYLWLPALGSEPGSEPKLGPQAPEAVRALLRLAWERNRSGQRVLFFCGCPYPSWEGKRTCHREEVSELLVTEARRLGERVRVEEWPGGEPVCAEREVSEQVFREVGRGLWSLPLEAPFDRAEMAGLPHGSIVTIRWRHEYKHLVCGSACVAAGQWSLPVFAWYSGTALEEAVERGRRHRRSHGFLHRDSEFGASFGLEVAPLNREAGWEA
jgi:hypothetical protein